ncbi:MAG: PqqD family protein [Cyanobacteria bacterium J06635_13]
MTVYKASTNYLYSEIDSEAVILDVNSGTYFGLNEVSNRIWQLLQTPTSKSAIIGQILAEYDVSPEEAEKDLHNLLEEMLSTGLVEKVNEEVAQVT